MATDGRKTRRRQACRGRAFPHHSRRLVPVIFAVGCPHGHPQSACVRRHARSAVECPARTPPPARAQAPPWQLPRPPPAASAPSAPSAHMHAPPWHPRGRRQLPAPAVPALRPLCTSRRRRCASLTSTRRRRLAMQWWVAFTYMKAATAYRKDS
jgi:hypothetical protein